MHTLREGAGEALLLLHGLGESHSRWGASGPPWPGPICALDFAGHAGSQWLPGGGYTPEHWLADADLALEHLGDRVALAGVGVGAYVALLLAGARPERVRAALLLSGSGLAGGGDDGLAWSRNLLSLEGWEAARDEAAALYAAGTDALVFEAGRDVRPASYAASFAASASALLLDARVGRHEAQPGWWRSARRHARCAQEVEGETESAFRALWRATHD